MALSSYSWCNFECAAGFGLRDSRSVVPSVLVVIVVDILPVILIFSGRLSILSQHARWEVRRTRAVAVVMKSSPDLTCVPSILNMHRRWTFAALLVFWRRLSRILSRRMPFIFVAAVEILRLNFTHVLKVSLPRFDCGSTVALREWLVLNPGLEQICWCSLRANGRLLLKSVLGT